MVTLWCSSSLSPTTASRIPVRLLEAAQGNGYVRLLAYDTERSAVLQEALGAPLNTLDQTPEQQIRALGQTLREAWCVPRWDGLTVEPVTEKAAQLGHLVERLWTSLGHPCSERVRDQALAYARSRAAAFDIDRCVVVHGDPILATPCASPYPGLAQNPGSCLWILTASWLIRRTTSASCCGIGRHSCSRETHPPSPEGIAGCSPRRPALMRQQSGNGASWSACRRASTPCSLPVPTCIGLS